MAESTTSAPIPTVPSHEIFLDEDERYEIFTVKAAERPHLLLGDAAISGGACGGPAGPGATGNPCDDEEKKDGCCGAGDCAIGCISDDLRPPLVDGCDLPNWRRHGLAFPPPSSAAGAGGEIQGRLNVGQGSSMFRRVGQLAAASCPAAGLDASLASLLKDLTEEEPPPGRAAAVVGAADQARPVPGNGQAGRIRTRFAAEYEERNVPAVITGATDGWEAMPAAGRPGGWTLPGLVGRFRDVAWRFSDVHGEMLTLGTYSKYVASVEGMTDDSPLAIYDAEFGDAESPTSVLLGEYEVPGCFSGDLFDLAERGSRPPYRWILIGPARSGTGLHVDPLWTNAWVTVLSGLKRWLLFPPGTPQEVIGMVEGRPQIPSSVWFRDYYRRVTSAEWPSRYTPVEVLQRPGETVFVPNGWPHLVLNLETTVAVTHNYASEHGPFERMWAEVADEEPDFARRWYLGMQASRPDLAKRVRTFHDKAHAGGERWATRYGRLD